jgi:hypothetical protein
VKSGRSRVEELLIAEEAKRLQLARAGGAAPPQGAQQGSPTQKGPTLGELGALIPPKQWDRSIVQTLFETDDAIKNIPLDEFIRQAHGGKSIMQQLAETKGVTGKILRLP